MSIRKALLALTVTLCFNGSLIADTLALKPDHPTRYVVVPGDTLWDISTKFLQDPWRWPEIWHLNPAIKNPHLIYPGDTISLVFVDGKPVLQLERGGSENIIKLSPQAHATQLGGAIRTVPATAISQFLFQPRILTQEQLDQAGYVAAAQDERLISGAGNTIYALKLAQEPGIKGYSVYRINQTYRNPENENDILGYEAIHVADAQLTAEGDPATLRITKSYRETFIGDKVLVSDAEQFDQSFLPHSPDQKVAGRIISLIDGMSSAGQHQTVVIDLGKQDGIEVGHVLAVSQVGDTIRNPASTGFFKSKIQLPDERAGLLMVVRSFDRISYAMVMNASRNIRVTDTVANP
ncbi:MAG: LysM peptidoglycan-binding domain-containing protein [Pseudomonadota bacterium]|nr:LysM peptidoglycan-binding domain-containing protein [Pseudomonadota bacterium]